MQSRIVRGLLQPLLTVMGIAAAVAAYESLRQVPITLIACRMQRYQPSFPPVHQQMLCIVMGLLDIVCSLHMQHLAGRLLIAVTGSSRRCITLSMHQISQYATPSRQGSPACNCTSYVQAFELLSSCCCTLCAACLTCCNVFLAVSHMYRCSHSLLPLLLVDRARTQPLTL